MYRNSAEHEFQLETKLIELKDNNKDLEIKNKILEGVINEYKKTNNIYKNIKLILRTPTVICGAIMGAIILIMSTINFGLLTISAIKNNILLSAQIACAPDTVENYSVSSNNVVCEANGRYRNSIRK